MTPILALPGTLCPPAVFDRLAESVDLRTWSWLTRPGPWDIPSLVADIAAQLDGPTLVIGHSTGGALALQLALSHPGLVAGLLLADTGAHMRDHGDVEAILLGLRENWGPELLGRILDRSFHEPLDPGTRAEWLAWALATDPRGAHDVLRSQHALDLRPLLHTVAVPTVVVHGRHDQARTVAHAQELATGIPGAELVLLDTGHTPVHEDPDAVARAVRRLELRLPA
ncbi:alpha/beta hydrolase [Kineosporia sp. J2-2]|uniref:Alpha/beta hydrolase n=1 Tax=Kineosporia corallincola TaxID=2835133 RepID=A0ABS5TCP0_9ACTN|nr:alpha/beta hydrolase [Kineosporia corallincola]MBT0767951.1 alpha/beta hydrolase [Kineosporia corallincola]